MQVPKKYLPLHRIRERCGNKWSFGALVQLVRIHACHAWGHGFESRTHRKKREVLEDFSFFVYTKFCFSEQYFIDCELFNWDVKTARSQSAEFYRKPWRKTRTRYSVSWSVHEICFVPRYSPVSFFLNYFNWIGKPRGLFVAVFYEPKPTARS